MGDHSESVCVIGLGQMGLPIAARLIGAGFDVRGVDLTPQSRAAFAASGGRSYNDASEAARGAGVIITILPNGKIVSDALLGPQGILHNTAEPVLIIDMSSSAPSDTIALAGKLEKRGVALVDAPVSGGVKRAVEGNLTIMMGGRDEDCARATHVLSPVASAIFHMGGVGSGHAAKALNNYVSACGTAAAMEATLLGKQYGIEPDRLIDVLNGSSGRNNATEVKMKQFVLSGSFASGFVIGLMAKDVGIAAEMASSRDLDLPVLEAISQLWNRAAKTLGAGVDHTEMMKFIDETASRSQV